MAQWNNNNLAHINTWGGLRGLREHRLSFPRAGVLRMDQLDFWNQAATPEARALAARELAGKLDDLFRWALHAKYEPGKNSASAVASMEKKLAEAQATLCDLGEAVDAAYMFRGEVR